MSNGRTLETKEDVALKEFCERLEIFQSQGVEEN